MFSFCVDLLLRGPHNLAIDFTTPTSPMIYFVRLMWCPQRDEWQEQCFILILLHWVTHHPCSSLYFIIVTWFVLFLCWFAFTSGQEGHQNLVIVFAGGQKSEQRRILARILGGVKTKTNISVEFLRLPCKEFFRLFLVVVLQKETVL